MLAAAVGVPLSRLVTSDQGPVKDRKTVVKMSGNGMELHTSAGLHGEEGAVQLRIQHTPPRRRYRALRMLFKEEDKPVQLKLGTPILGLGNFSKNLHALCPCGYGPNPSDLHDTMFTRRIATEQWIKHGFTSVLHHVPQQVQTQRERREARSSRKVQYERLGGMQRLHGLGVVGDGTGVEGRGGARGKEGGGL